MTAIEQRVAAGHADPDPILGLFSQEPDLMDAVMEDAMATREQQTLRHPAQQ